MGFRWNDWNYDHIAKHGIQPAEAEYVVAHARPPFPESREDEKWLVWGSTEFGKYLQVIYIHDADGTIYIIHARPLTETEKRRLRRRIR